MTHRKCLICGEDIVLKPSAAERAKKHGETPEFYLSLFTTHPKCAIEQRNQSAADLMRRAKKEGYHAR